MISGTKSDADPDLQFCGPTKTESIRSMWSSLGISHSHKSEDTDGRLSEGTTAAEALVRQKLSVGGASVENSLDGAKPENTDAGLPEDSEDDSGEAIRGDLDTALW